jgi:pyruvate dehydrogenase complex dehydrogenase (E1) component
MAANTQNALADIDAQETKEWLDALEASSVRKAPTGPTS